MSPADQYLPPEDAAFAAEYVLGLLPENERTAFEARLAADPSLANEVRAWQERLAAMAEEVAPVPPRPRVKRALQKRLFGTEPRGALRFWQGLSVAGLAAAAGLAFLLLQAPAPAPDAPVYAAEVAADDDSLRLLAVYDPAAAELRLTRTQGAARPGRVLELWLIAGDEPPKSLGVLPEADIARLTVPETLRAAIDGGTLAVSDEPPGGSPTGAPTGDVLAVGAIARL